MKRLLLLILALLILAVSACSAKDAARTYVIEPSETAAPQPTSKPTPEPTQDVPDMDFSKVYGAYDAEQVLAEPTLYEWTEGVCFPVKPPKVGEYAEKGYHDVNDVAWRGIDARDYAEFCDGLTAEGWKKYRIGKYHQFVRDNDVIYLVNYLSDAEENGSSNNVFTIKWKRGCKTPCADGRVSARSAAQIIWPRICELTDADEKSEIAAITELEDDELFKKLGMQIFTAFTQNSYSCTFLIRDDETGFFTDSECPPVFADVDGDGTEEYITLTGGNVRNFDYEITAYGKSVVPKYHSKYILSHEFYGMRCRLQKLNDGAHLIGVEYETGKMVANMGRITSLGDGLTAQGIGEYIEDTN